MDVLTGHDLFAESHPTRYIQIGEMAGPTLNLAAATLRSANIQLSGQGGGSLPKEILAKIPLEIIPMILNWAAEGIISIDTVTYLLTEIQTAWKKKDSDGKRSVIIP